MNHIQEGDVVLSSHVGYNHYGIYTEDNTVVHYWKESYTTGVAEIKETSLDEFTKNNPLYVCQFKQFSVGNFLLKAVTNLITPPNHNPLSPKKSFGLYDNESEYERTAYHIFSPKETVARARSKITVTGYNLIFNNCEHFALWCKTGVSSSEQVNRLLKLLTPHQIWHP